MMNEVFESHYRCFGLVPILVDFEEASELKYLWSLQPDTRCHAPGLLAHCNVQDTPAALLTSSVTYSKSAFNNQRTGSEGQLSSRAQVRSRLP